MRLSVALVCAAATFVASIEAAPPGYSESADLQATWEAEHGGPAPEYDFDEEENAMLMARGVDHGQNMPKGGHKHHMARDAQATGVENLDDATEATPGIPGIPKATDLSQALKDLYDRFVGSDEDDTASKMMRRGTDDDLYDYDDPDDLADTTGKETTAAQREASGPDAEEEVDPALLEDRGLGEMEELERRSLEEDIAIGQSDSDEEFDGDDLAEHEKRGLEATDEEMSAYADLDPEMTELLHGSDHAEHEKRGVEATEDEMSAYADLETEGEMGEFSDEEHLEHEKRGLETEHGQDWDDEDPDDELPHDESQSDMGEFTSEEHAEHEKRGLEATEDEMSAYADLIDAADEEHVKRGLDEGELATDEEMSQMAELADGEDSNLARREADADASRPKWKWGSWKSLHTRSEQEGEGFPDEESFFEPEDGEMGEFTDSEHAEHEKRGLEATADEGSGDSDVRDLDDEPLPGEEDDGDMGEFTDEEHAEHEKRGIEATDEEMSAYADLDDLDNEVLPGEEKDGDMGEFTDAEHAEHEKRGIEATDEEMSAYADLDDEALPGEEDNGEMGEFSQEEHEEHEKRGLEDDLTLDTEDDDLEPEESLTEAEIAALMAKEDTATATAPVAARDVPSGFTHLPSHARPAYPTGSGAPSLPPYRPRITAHKTPSPTPWFKFPW